jgi:hypothetical protein
MKAKDLIKILQACDPDTLVEVDFERVEKFRMDMLNACIAKGSAEALTQMDIDGAILEEGLQGEDEHTISCILYAAVRRECL